MALLKLQLRKEIIEGSRLENARFFRMAAGSGTSHVNVTIDCDFELSKLIFGGPLLVFRGLFIDGGVPGG